MSTIQDEIKQSIINYIQMKNGPKDLTLENLNSRIYDVLKTLALTNKTKSTIQELMHFIENPRLKPKQILHYLNERTNLAEFSEEKEIFDEIANVHAQGVVAKHIKARHYSRKANAAFSDFKQVHDIDIRKKSKENLDNVLARLKTSQDYYSAEVKIELIARRREGQIFTPQETALVEKMLNSDEWVIQHATHDVHRVLEGDSILLSVDERKRRGMEVANDHSPANDGNNDNVFFSVGFGKHAAPRFLSDVADKLVINLSEMQRDNPGAYDQLWTSGHVAAYQSQAIYEHTLFGFSQKLTSYAKAAKGYEKTYTYPNLDSGSRSQKINLEDEIVVGKHIKPFLTYMFIETLRSIGGSYRQNILNNLNDFEVVKKAFHAIFHGGMMEVHAPAKILLDPKYSAIHVGAVFTKDFFKAAAVGDIQKMQVLINKGAQVNIVDMNIALTEPHTPLQMASLNGSVSAVKFLIEQGAILSLKRELSAFDTPVYTALMFAARGGHLACVQLILNEAKKIDPNGVKYAEDFSILNELSNNEHGAISALGLALNNGHWEVAELLLQNGAKVSPLSLGFEGSYGNSNKWNEKISIQFISYLREHGIPIPNLNEIIISAMDNKYFTLLDFLWEETKQADVQTIIESKITEKLVHGDVLLINYLINKSYDFEKLARNFMQKISAEDKSEDGKNLTIGFLFLPKLPVDVLNRLPLAIRKNLTEDPANFQFIGSQETLRWWQANHKGSIDKSLIKNALEMSIRLESFDYADFLMESYKKELDIGLKDHWVSHALRFSEVNVILFLLKHNIVKSGVTKYSLFGSYSEENPESKDVETTFGPHVLYEMFKSSMNDEKYALAVKLIKQTNLDLTQFDMMSFLKDRSTKATWKIIQCLEDNALYKFTPAEVSSILVSIPKKWDVQGSDQKIKREAVDFFLAKGADVNAVDQEGHTLLINFIQYQVYYNENIIEYLFQKGAAIDAGFPFVTPEKTYENALDLLKASFHSPSEFILNLFFKEHLNRVLAIRSTQCLYEVFTALSVTPKYETFFWEHLSSWRALDRSEIDELKSMAEKNRHQHCLAFIAKYEKKLPADIQLIHPELTPKIFITTAPNIIDFAEQQTGDIDYANTLAMSLNAVLPNQVEFIPKITDEESLYKHIFATTLKTEQPVLHLLVNAPNIGFMLTPGGIQHFKDRGGKVIVTAVEFAKHARRFQGEKLQTDTINYLEKADKIIFLDEHDQKTAIDFARSMKKVLPPSAIISVPPTVPTTSKPLKERGKDIISFGIIRDGKGFAHLLHLAELISQSDNNSIKHKKILIVGSVGAVQQNNYDRSLEKIMLAMYPNHKNMIVNKSPLELVKLKSEYFDQEKIKAVLPIELHLNVPADQLIPLFNRCTYSYLPSYRGATLRNSSISSSVANQFITYAHDGKITPSCLQKHGKHAEAMVLVPYIPGLAIYSYAAQSVLSDISRREAQPDLNIITVQAAARLANQELDPTLIAGKHLNVYRRELHHDQSLQADFNADQHAAAASPIVHPVISQSPVSDQVVDKEKLISFGNILIKMLKLLDPKGRGLRGLFLGHPCAKELVKLIDDIGLELKSGPDYAKIADNLNSFRNALERKNSKIMLGSLESFFQEEYQIDKMSINEDNLISAALRPINPESANRM